LLLTGGVHGPGEFTGEGGEAAAYAFVEVAHALQVGFDGGLHASGGWFGGGGGFGVVYAARGTVFGLFGQNRSVFDRFRVVFGV
jgi:hypothetical protein